MPCRTVVKCGDAGDREGVDPNFFGTPTALGFTRNGESKECSTLFDSQLALHKG